MFKGITHCHSTYSDGEFNLKELREVLISEGLDFVCMSDHAEAFDEDTLRAYVEECATLSDDRFLFIAGLEFECERRMHVLGYGVTTRSKTTNPQDVIRHIDSLGGVSVIAHPMDSMFPWIETFDVLPLGIEAWNSKYDGRYAPRARTFDLLHCLQQRKPELQAFYGTDLHWKKQFRQLRNVVQCTSLTRDFVLSAIKSGHYYGLKDGIELPSNGRVSSDLLARYEATNARYHRVRGILKRARKMSGRLGSKLPAPLKAQLRRIF